MDVIKQTVPGNESKPQALDLRMIECHEERREVSLTTPRLL